MIVRHISYVSQTGTKQKARPDVNGIPLPFDTILPHNPFKNDTPRCDSINSIRVGWRCGMARKLMAPDVELAPVVGIGPRSGTNP